MKKRIAALGICLVLLLGLLGAECHALTYDLQSAFFSSTELYEEYLDKTRMPPDFVHVSRFSLLGKMELCSIGKSPHRAYYYRFTSGVEIKINHNIGSIAVGREPLTKIPEGTKTMLKMHVSAPEDRFCYFRNGLYYIYNTSKGNLESIKWFADGIHFEIPIDHEKLHRYESISVITRLLSVSEADADSAILELCESAGLKLQTEHYQVVAERTDKIVRTVLISGLVAAIAISWIVAKKRRTRGIIARRPQNIAQDKLPLSAFINHDPPINNPNSH